jgi:hypothetical protein
MAAEKNHPIFREPNDPDIKIWRYMDFTKFVSLLESKSLYFARSDLFEDMFEGSLSSATFAWRAGLWEGLLVDQEELEKFSKAREQLRKQIFLNCWHMNARESAAMWKLYARSNEAVAIQSTYRLLHSCLPANTYVGEVQYIDYETDYLAEDHLLRPYIHKRISFEHERELRALIYIRSDNPNDYLRNHIAVKDVETRVGEPVGDAGCMVSVNLNDLIERVYVAPTCAAWFTDLVLKMMNQYQLNKPLIKSALDAKPMF